jgi:hypothetical protein
MKQQLRRNIAVHLLSVHEPAPCNIRYQRSAQKHDTDSGKLSERAGGRLPLKFEQTQAFVMYRVRSDDHDPVFSSQILLDLQMWLWALIAWRFRSHCFASSRPGSAPPLPASCICVIVAAITEQLDFNVQQSDFISHKLAYLHSMRTSHPGVKGSHDCQD